MNSITDEEFFELLEEFIMPEQQMMTNGFPFPHPDGPRGRAKIYTICPINESCFSAMTNQRVCCRCHKRYIINSNGFAVKSEICTYHSGHKVITASSDRYNCCDNDRSPRSGGGCVSTNGHVWDYLDFDKLYGFMEAGPRGKPAEGQEIYAISCEMCYTTRGFEPIKITIVDRECKIVYDTFIKPKNYIIDFNTSISGIIKSDLRKVTRTIRHVHGFLMCLLSKETIIVGHRLEKIFKALKVIHLNNIDTSLVFPNTTDFPYKRTLKSLSMDYLGKAMPSKMKGYKTIDDAVACMQLICRAINRTKQAQMV